MLFAGVCLDIYGGLLHMIICSVCLGLLKCLDGIIVMQKWGWVSWCRVSRKASPWLCVNYKSWTFQINHWTTAQIWTGADLKSNKIHPVESLSHVANRQINTDIDKQERLHLKPGCFLNSNVFMLNGYMMQQAKIFLTSRNPLLIFCELCILTLLPSLFPLRLHTHLHCPEPSFRHSWPPLHVNGALHHPVRPPLYTVVPTY